MTFNCKIKTLKNWFSYRRKKFGSLNKNYIKKSHFIPSCTEGSTASYLQKSSECYIMRPEISKNVNQEPVLTNYPKYFPFSDYEEEERKSFEQGFSYSYGWLLIPVNSLFPKESLRPMISHSIIYYQG